MEEFLKCKHRRGLIVDEFSKKKLIEKKNIIDELMTKVQEEYSMRLIE